LKSIDSLRKGVTPLTAIAGGGTNAEPMPGQLNLFDRGASAAKCTCPDQPKLHCMVVDTVRCWRMPGWMIWTQNHSLREEVAGN
jgi:hypothetical protein